MTDVAQLAATLDAVAISQQPHGLRRALRSPLQRVSWRECVRDQLQALLMARHARLGVDSPAASLPADCARNIRDQMLLLPPVVIDAGSATCKACLAGADENVLSEGACYEFANVVGRSTVKDILGILKDTYVGDEALEKASILRLTYPVCRGYPACWDDLEKVWRHCFIEELRVSPDAQPVMVTEAPVGPKAARERMAEIMFGAFGVPRFHACCTATLALFASGRTTGVLVEIGDGVSHIAPIYMGAPLPHATVRLQVGGNDLTSCMMRLVNERGYDFSYDFRPGSVPHRRFVQELKEKVCARTL